ncbi:MAG TPA: hypothetical protein VFE79_20720, partial [Paraburkholderia sp.]|nr:hypothetical protein [Paraburkholderia sp.]
GANKITDTSARYQLWNVPNNKAGKTAFVIQGGTYDKIYAAFIECVAMGIRQDNAFVMTDAKRNLLFAG